MTILCIDFATKRISTMDGAPSASTEPDVLGPVLTSQVYPVEVVEEMDVGASSRNGQLYQLPQDNIDVAAIPLDGTLVRTVGYRTYDDAELLDVAAIPLNGTLVRTIGYQTYADAESLDVAALPLNGTLITTVHFVDYAIDEGLDVAAIPLDGTLI